MRRVRRFLKQIFQGKSDTSSQAYSYRVYWTRIARAWDAERRGQVRSATQAVIESPGFLPNEMLRRYRVPEIDSLAHAGASLVALVQVLDALQTSEGGEQHG